MAVSLTHYFTGTGCLVTKSAKQRTDMKPKLLTKHRRSEVGVVDGFRVDVPSNWWSQIQTNIKSILVTKK